MNFELVNVLLLIIILLVVLLIRVIIILRHRDIISRLIDDRNEFAYKTNQEAGTELVGYIDFMFIDFMGGFVFQLFSIDKWGIYQFYPLHILKKTMNVDKVEGTE